MKDDFINKVRISFDFGNNVTEASAISESNDLYDKHVSVAIERAFSEYNQADDLRIERLEIDLGEVTRERLEEEVYLALTRRFNEYGQNMTARSYPDVPGALTGSGSPESIPPRNVHGDNHYEENSLESNHSGLTPAAFREYLLYRKFPWYVDPDDYDIEKQLEGLLSSDEGLESFLRSLDPVAFLRFMGMLSTDGIFRILKMYSSASGKDAVAVSQLRYYLMKKYGRLPQVSPEIFSMSESFVQTNLFSAVYTSEEEDRLLMVFCIARSLGLELPFHQQSLSEFASVFSEDPFPADIEEARRYRTDSPESARVFRLQNTSVRERFRKFESLTYTKLLEEVRRNELADDSESERLLVENAGIVLLSPWFVNLFEACGYLDENGEFRSLASRIRAVHLLMYLSGYTEKHYDYQLSLSKIICGLPIGFPVDSVFSIYPREEEECTALLTMAVEYWPSLKGSTAHALQETFLMRKGLLEKSETDWIVRIEPKTLDILMEDIPWGFSMISSQWNEYLIYVEWNRS